MIETLPVYVSVVFAITTVLTVFLFFKATRSSRFTLSILFAWIIIQGIAALSGFYLVENTLPPRMALLAGPALLFITVLFLSVKGKVFLDSLNLRTLTWLHTIRIAVEVVLFLLYQNDAVPQLMTFAGRNFDILAGLSAPIAVYFGFNNSLPKKPFLIAWNIMSLALLFNIVSLAILSAPTPLQQLAFDHPNIAVLHFPFVWLPCCVVPLVLLAHLAALRQLLKRN